MNKMTATARTIKLVLIDLSGTLHIDDTVIPGAVESLLRLRKTGVSVQFVTNTTKESRSLLHSRLVNLGFDIKPEEIMSSLWAARELVEQKQLNPLLLVDDNALEDFKDVMKSEGTEHDSVLVGLAPEKFKYDDLNDAFRILLKGAPLIAIHEGRYYKRKDGLALGPGPFVKGLEYAAGCKAEVVGKPTANFFQIALNRNNVKAEDAVMIGDDVQDDVNGAQAIGIRGYLVQTGKYRSGDEATIDPAPHHVAANFTNAVDAILEEINNSTLSQKPTEVANNLRCRCEKKKKNST